MSWCLKSGYLFLHPATNAIPKLDRRFFWCLVAIENQQEDCMRGRARGPYIKSNEGPLETSRTLGGDPRPPWKTVV